jgi:hypothetical protein
MLTGSERRQDANSAFFLGANSFLVKPLDFLAAAALSRSIEQ